MEGVDYTTYEDGVDMIDVIRKRISFQKKSGQNFDDAFHVMDLGYQVRMVDQFKKLLPGVTPFYAVKSNPDPVLLGLLAKMNFGFDCASKKEIETIIGLDVPPSRIIYSNTRKQPSHLQYGASMGVDLTTFDDSDELTKIHQRAPNMKLLIRISTDGFTKNSSELMTGKFGCPKQNTKKLLAMAKKLRLNVIGTSFHVGIFARTSDAFSLAIKECKRVFLEARELGFEMKLLDLGGGLPPKTTAKLSTLKFEEVASKIRQAIQENFGAEENLTVIAEPGSLFTMPSTALVTSIIGKRHRKSPAEDSLPELEYFINDGIYSSFRLYDTIPGKDPVAKPVAPKYSKASLHKARIWGQTCADDLVLKDCELPNISTGDWVYFPDCGSYSAAMVSNFNGFRRRPLLRYINESNKKRLVDIISEGGFRSNSPLNGVTSPYIISLTENEV